MNHWLRRMLPRRAAAPVLAALAGLGAMALVGWMARDTWFIQDHWDFIAAREAGSLDDLFRPHAGHWQTYTVLLNRGLYAVFGMDYVPGYLLPRVLFPAAVAFAVWLAMRWRGADPWLAGSVYGVLLVSGVSGWHTSATIGNSLAHLAALAAAAIVARGDGSSRRDVALLAIVLTVAVSASGLGIAVYLGTALVVAVTGTIRRWYPALVVPAAAFTTWWLAYGRDGGLDPDTSLDTILGAPKVALDLLASSLASSAALSDGFGPVLAVVLAGFVVLLVGRLGRFEGVLLGAALAYVPMVVLGRVAAGQANADAWRYAYVLTMLLVPAIVPHVRLRAPNVRALVVGGVLLLLVANLGQLRSNVDFWERRSTQSRKVVEAAATLIAAGEPALAEASPDPRRDGVLTVAGVRRLLSDGWEPAGGDASPRVQEEARGNIRMEVVAGAGPRGPGPATDSALDEEGCIAVEGDDPLRLTVAGGDVSVTGSGALVRLAWEDGYGPGILDLDLGSDERTIRFADVPGAIVTVTAEEGAARVCGLRTG